MFHHTSWGSRLGAAVSAAALGGGMLALAGVSTAAPAAAAACSPAGATGFTAAVVATSGQTITGKVDASGCNLGIYIGPGATGVTVNGATVQNATDHAILVENTSGATIENSTIDNNGTKPNNNLGGDDAVFFAGVADSMITNNTFTNDFAGGIRIADDGPFDPGAPNPGPAAQVPSSNVTVSGNKLTTVYGGCAVIVAVYNSGPGDQNVSVTGNTITGAIGKFGPYGPIVGQIVVAGDGVGAVIQGTKISGNTVTQSIPTGIVLHPTSARRRHQRHDDQRQHLEPQQLGQGRTGAPCPPPSPWRPRRSPRRSRRRSPGRRSPATRSPLSTTGSTSPGLPAAATPPSRPTATR